MRARELLGEAVVPLPVVLNSARYANGPAALGLTGFKEEREECVRERENKTNSKNI